MLRGCFFAPTLALLQRRQSMPIITFDGGAMTREQKADLVREFTATSSRITGIPEQAFVIIIRENSHENIGVGGELLVDRLGK
jgi:4-oxalocrotonate tautomerase